AGGTRVIQTLARPAQEALICFGPHREKQPTFPLLDAGVAAAPGLVRDEALARLAERYFTSHGPATVRDFAWWSGLTMADAKAGLAGAAARLAADSIGGLAYRRGRRRRPPPAAHRRPPALPRAARVAVR